MARIVRDAAHGAYSIATSITTVADATDTTTRTAADTTSAAAALGSVALELDSLVDQFQY